MYKERKGDLIALAKIGYFNVIAHGVNCMCTQRSGIAKHMTEEFSTNMFPKEFYTQRGQYDKLGNIDFKFCYKSSGYRTGFYNTIVLEPKTGLYVVNCYTQFNYGKNHQDGDETPLNYTALAMCLDKINYTFKGLHIGLPKIGCGLAGGDWNIVKTLINKKLKDCNVTVVIKD